MNINKKSKTMIFERSILRYLFPVMSAVQLLTACSKSVDETGIPAMESSRFRVEVAPYTGDAGVSDRELPTTLHAWHFEQGRLVEQFGPLTVSSSEVALPLTSNTGAVYFMAAADDLLPQAAEGCTEQEWLDLTSSNATGLVQPFATGCVELPATSGGVVAPVTLTRGMARLDLQVRVVGSATVERITLRNVAHEGYLFSAGTFRSPADAERGDVVCLDNGTLTADTPGIACLYEQEGTDMKVQMEAVVNGRSETFETALPERIERNTIYTVTLLKETVDAEARLTVEAWSQAQDTPMQPDLAGQLTIDASRSEFPDGVRVMDDGTTLDLPYAATELVMAVKSDIQLELQSVSDPLLTVEEEPFAAGDFDGLNRFRIRKLLYVPEIASREVVLRFRRKGLSEIYDEDCITLQLEANPTQVEGLISFAEANYTCDFGRYVENELGRLTLPEGKRLVAEFDGGEDPWLKVEPAEEDGNVWRVLGGWCPNDPNADGRSQSARMVICDMDGSHREEYTLVRRNWGLPVVRIGNTWWCKYNLRGDATRFEDQITLANDPVASADLADYLAAADDAELLDLLGDQYQGGNIQGLPLRHNGTAYYYEGVAGSAQNFGTLDPSSMAPAGYRIPGYDDFAYLSRNENYNLGSVGDHSYTNASGNPLSVRIIQRQATFLEQNYGPVMLYEFHEGDSVWVLCGLGHQWDTTAGNIAKLQLLFATTGNSSKCWVMEGHAQTESANGNWLKFMANNAKKTRTLRCVKAPVEYEYAHQN